MNHAQRHTLSGSKLFLVLAICCLIAGALTATPASAAPTPSPTPSLSSSAETQRVSLRTLLGYRSDLAYVRSLPSAEGTVMSDIDLPMTPAENADFKARRALLNRGNDIDTAFSKDATYAGTWMDQPGGGILMVAFTSPATKASGAKITSLIPAGAPLKMVQVTWSLQQLNAVNSRISDQMVSDAETHKLNIVSAGVDLVHNTIAVTIPKDAPPTAEADLAGRYGKALTVTRGDLIYQSSSRDIRSGALYGGEWIGGPASSCTDGYSNMRDSSNKIYTVTAGHCDFPGSTSWIQGLDGTRSIGTFRSNGSWDKASTNCDCVEVGPLPSGLSTNQVLVGGNGKYTYTKTGTPRITEIACHTGAASYEDPSRGNNKTIQCGDISLTNAQQTISNELEGNTFVLKDAIQANIHVQSGDSGAPLGDGGSFLGIVSARSNNSSGSPSYYSKTSNMGTVGLHAAY